MTRLYAVQWTVPVTIRQTIAAESEEEARKIAFGGADWRQIINTGWPADVQVTEITKGITVTVPLAGHSAQGGRNATEANDEGS